MEFRMSRFAIALTTVIVAAWLSGCARLEPPPNTTPEGLLAGTAWQLQQLGTQRALEGNRPTLAFAKAGTVSGTGSCNQFNGSVTVNGKSITFGPLATTRMSCADALNAQEMSYFKALQQAEWFTITGSTLTIYTKATDQPLVFLRTQPK
jgi:heat shock protein HslJ